MSNELCPKGWAWLILDCDFNEYGCLACKEENAPGVKK